MSVQHIPSQNSTALGYSASIDQAAQLLGVSRRTVYNRIKDGRLQTYTTQWGARRVVRSSVYELMAATPHAAAAPMRVPERALGVA